MFYAMWAIFIKALVFILVDTRKSDIFFVILHKNFLKTKTRYDPQT